MTSLKAFAAQCLGLSPGFSLVRDFLGHWELPKGANYSVRAQLALLRTAYIHINLIVVGDGIATAPIDSAVFRMRRIYAKVGLGVGRIVWRLVPAAIAGGHDVIDSDEEACELTNSWTVHNCAPDIFIIQSGWTGNGIMRTGISGTDGPCNKDDDTSWTGSVISLQGDLTGAVMAHEVGHYLGLEHVDGLSADDVLDPEVFAQLTSEQKSNLMLPVLLGIPEPGLRLEQGDRMKRHCFVQSGC